MRVFTVKVPGSDRRHFRASTSVSALHREIRGQQQQGIIPPGAFSVRPVTDREQRDFPLAIQSVLDEAHRRAQPSDRTRKAVVHELARETGLTFIKAQQVVAIVERWHGGQLPIEVALAAAGKQSTLPGRAAA